MRRNQTDPETFWSGKLLFGGHTLTLRKYTSLAQFFWTATAETRCPSVSWVFKWRGRMSARTITAKPGTSDINSNQFDWSFSSFAKPLSASPHFDYSTPTSLFMFVLKKWLLWSRALIWEVTYISYMHFLTLLSRPGVCLYLYCHRPIDIQLWSQLGPRSNHPGESEKVWLRNMNCFRSKHPVWKLSSDFSRKWLFILSRKKTQETSVIVDVVGQGNPQGLPQGTRTGEYQRHAPRYSTPRVPKDALISDTWKKWKKTRRCCENMFKKKTWNSWNI